MKSNMKAWLVSIFLASIPAITQADAKAGREKAELCILCHKPANSEPFVPRLQGQTREYVYAQIKAFKEKKRSSFSMMAMNVEKLTDKDMHDLADYFASQQPPKEDFSIDERRSAKGASKAAELLCAACHQPSYLGKGEVARLAGLSPKYTALQISNIQAGQRSHPASQSMKNLAREEVEDIAQYLAQLH